MSHSLETEGYAIHRSVLSDEEIAVYREEADRVAHDAKSACVRHLRRQSTLFDDLSQDGKLLSLLPPGLIPVRSILFDKTRDENWPVAWHQDLTIAVAAQVDVPDYKPWSIKDGCPHVQPPTSLLSHMVTIRIHLDDTPSTNGALRVIPVSHLSGKLSSDETAGFLEKGDVTCDCLAGDVLLMKPLILHSSRRSEYPERRRVIHFEYARSKDLHSGLEWAE